MDINNATLDDDMMNGPHFVIAGAMKSGTTWLHKALNSVSGVTIPKDEVHLYDCNDPIVHPEFQKITFRGLALRRAKETVWGDYICETRDLLGYDSTTLFHSKIDYKKLAKDEPSLKIIVILRNPVDRSYSHYWHLVRTGRVKFNFEREILFGRQEILERSFYVANAERLTQSFGSRCLFVCYESLFSEREENLDRIGKFLELSSSQIKELKNFTSNRANEGRYPRFPLLWRFFSRMIPMNQSFRYQKQLFNHSISEDTPFPAFKTSLRNVKTDRTINSLPRR